LCKTHKNQGRKRKGYKGAVYMRNTHKGLPKNSVCLRNLKISHPQRNNPKPSSRTPIIAQKRRTAAGRGGGDSISTAHATAVPNPKNKADQKTALKTCYTDEQTSTNKPANAASSDRQLLAPCKQTNRPTKTPPLMMLRLDTSIRYNMYKIQYLCDTI